MEKIEASYLSGDIGLQLVEVADNFRHGFAEVARRSDVEGFRAKRFENLLDVIVSIAHVVAKAHVIDAAVAVLLQVNGFGGTRRLKHF